MTAIVIVGRVTNEKNKQHRSEAARDHDILHLSQISKYNIVARQ